MDMKPQLGNPIPDQYKVRLGEGWETLEERVAGIEQRQKEQTDIIKRLKDNFDNPGVRYLYDTTTEYGGFLIIQDLSYTTYKIYNKNGKEVEGLSGGSFKGLSKAQQQIDLYNALHKTLEHINGQNGLAERSEAV